MRTVNCLYILIFLTLKFSCLFTAVIVLVCSKFSNLSDGDVIASQLPEIKKLTGKSRPIKNDREVWMYKKHCLLNWLNHDFSQQVRSVIIWNEVKV